MMQALLAERFRLQIHHETREFPIYALVVDDKGPKIQLSDPEGDPAASPFRKPGAGHLIGTKVNAAMLAKVLSDQLKKAVRDETGLKGVFDFNLVWTEEVGAGSIEPGPSLFSALREQLGLRLVARRGPVDVVVIDRVERVPTEN